MSPFSLKKSDRSSGSRWRPSWDGLGIAASVTCAIHCMAAPIVLALSPLLGSIWASPLVHVALASVSLPAAYLLVRRDVRVHQRAWVLWLASAGAVAVMIGLIAPAMAWCKEWAIVVNTPGWMEAMLPADAAGTGCTDECCASVSHGAEGSTFRLPFASIITMFGGVMLVVSHVANLCLKGRCSKADCACD